MTDPDLICNYRKCGKRLDNIAWVTTCSHAFCDEHGTQEFSTSNNCPACKTQLGEKYEVIRQDLHLSQQHKAMMLCGQKPDVLIEVFSRAHSFWMYQTSQKAAYQEYLVRQEKERSDKLGQYYEQIVIRMKEEIISSKSKFAELRKELKTELEEVKKKNHQILDQLNERTRQYQKLQSMYDQLKRNSINPAMLGAGDQSDQRVMSPSPKVPHRYIHMNSVGGAGDVLRHSPLPTHCTHSTHSGREFVFRPNTTPIADLQFKNKVELLNQSTPLKRELAKKSLFDAF